ncbi:MAG: histidine kinase, partial [Anaerolineales bacterium]
NLGLVQLSDKYVGEFTPEDEAILVQLAQIASAALENLRLLEETKRWNAELEQRVAERTTELQIANTQLQVTNTQLQTANVQLAHSEEQLRRLSSYLQQVREDERTRIAREIHDELGQALTGLKMDVSWLKSRLGKRQTALLEKAEAMSHLIDTTVQSVRRISTDLRPGILDDLGLLAAIEWQLQDFQMRTGVECQLNTACEEMSLDGDAATALFRIFQETLTNVARHAQATRVEVLLEENEGHLLLQVRDNGKGLSAEKLETKSKTFGLTGIRERALLLSGEVAISGQPGQGTTVTVRVPLQPALATLPEVRTRTRRTPESDIS